MLLKWVLLIIIAWYISKAIGNIIGALRGEPVPPAPPLDSRPTDPIHQSPKASTVARRIDEREIEDARFKDL